jgi:hypothetical protein
MHEGFPGDGAVQVAPNIPAEALIDVYHQSSRLLTGRIGIRENGD